MASAGASAGASEGTGTVTGAFRGRACFARGLTCVVAPVSARSDLADRSLLCCMMSPAISIEMRVGCLAALAGPALDSGPAPCHSEKWRAGLPVRLSISFSSADGTSTLAARLQETPGLVRPEGPPSGKSFLSRHPTQFTSFQLAQAWPESHPLPCGRTSSVCPANEWIAASCVQSASFTGRTSARGGQSGWYRGQ